MYRHQQEHLPAARSAIVEENASESPMEGALLAKITRLEAEARRLGKKAEDAGDFRGAMAAVRELVRIVELLARMQGELQEPSGTTVNVVYVNPLGREIPGRTGAIVVPAEFREPGTHVTTNSASSTHQHQSFSRPEPPDRV
jgi:hypothetical protein